MQYLEAISKMTEWSLFISKETIQYHSNPSLCPNQYRWRSWSSMVLWRPTRPSRTNTKKRFFSSQGCQSLSCVWLFVTLWTVARQASQSMGFSRQEYWTGLPFPSPGDLPDPAIKLRSLALQADSLPSDSQEKPHHRGLECKSRKSRDIWSNRQVWPWSTKWSRAKANSFAKKTHWS